MSEEIIKLIKLHWMEIGTKEEKDLLNTLKPEVKTQYQDAIHRLEFDFDFQRQLGIGC